MAHLSRKDAEGFYAVHKGRPFSNDLVAFMSSGPVMIRCSRGRRDQKNRDLMGATDPKKAAAGTSSRRFRRFHRRQRGARLHAPETAKGRDRLFLPADQVYSR